MTIYFDCGAQDRYGFNVGTFALDKLLTRRGVPHEAHIYPGGHDWPYVLEHFAASLEAQSKGPWSKLRRILRYGIGCIRVRERSS